MTKMAWREFEESHPTRSELTAMKKALTRLANQVSELRKTAAAREKEAARLSAPRDPVMSAILADVAKRRHFTPEQILSRRNHQMLVLARRIAMFRCHGAGLPIAAISAFFGTNRTAVIFAAAKVEMMIAAAELDLGDIQ